MEILALIAAAAPAAAPAAENPYGLWEALEQGGLIAWSVAMPLIEGDENGALQAGISIAAAQGITQLLKHTIPKTRPDGSDRRSFPSGHTATAFAAAGSILERRGASEGAPAALLASLVGTARVKARKHDWTDVVAGAAIGSASKLAATRPNIAGRWARYASAARSPSTASSRRSMATQRWPRRARR